MERYPGSLESSNATKSSNTPKLTQVIYWEEKNNKQTKPERWLPLIRWERTEQEKGLHSFFGRGLELFKVNLCSPWRWDFTSRFGDFYSIDWEAESSVRAVRVSCWWNLAVGGSWGRGWLLLWLQKGTQQEHEASEHIVSICRK